MAFLALGQIGSLHLPFYDSTGWSLVSGTGSTVSSARYFGFSPVGDKVAVGEFSSPYLRVLSAPSWTLDSGTPTLPGLATSFAYSPDGAMLCIGGGSAIGYYRIYNTSDWSQVGGLPALGVAPGDNSIAWSPDGQYIAFGASNAQGLYILNTSTWTFESGVPAIAFRTFGQLAWSPDSARLAVAVDTSPSIRVYTAGTWAAVSGVPSYGWGVGVCWSPDGTKLGVVNRQPDWVRELLVSDWSDLSGQIALPNFGGQLDYSPDGALIALNVNSSGTPVRVLRTSDYGAETTGLSGTGAYLAKFVPAPAGDVTAFELPIELTVVQSEALELPIELTVSSEVATFELPLQLLVYAPSVFELPLQLRVFDGAVEGGLDGAAGWAAAPTGVWQPYVVLDGQDISSRIDGEVRITNEANSASVARVSFVPVSPIQPLDLIGRSIRIAFAQAGGANAQLMFSGIVDVPSVDVQTGALTLECHDQAQERWAATPRSTIDALVGGRWHVAVSGEAEDGFVYMTERLRSVRASWAIDPEGTLRILPWRDETKAVTVREADGIDGSLSVELPSRTELRTRVSCRFQYRYTQLRARGAAIQFAQPLSFFLPDSTPTQLRAARHFLTVAMIEGATSSASGWRLAGEVEIEHPPSGAILLDGTTLDPEAIFLISPQAAQDLAIGFRARYESRWQQSVTEDYTFELVATALEAQVGTPIAEEIGATLEAEFDQPGWGTDDSVEPVLAPPGLGDVVEAWQPPGYDAAQRDEALRTLADVAYVRLCEASRSGRARFSIPLRPDLWLDTRFTVIAGAITVSGDAEAIEHVLNPITGEATSSYTLAVGMPGDTPAAHPSWTLPAPPVDGYEPPDSAFEFVCGTYVGGDATSPPYDAETMIGFVTNTEGSIEDRNYYPIRLDIESPALAAEDRDPLILEATETVSVAVPTDKLEIT